MPTPKIKLNFRESLREKNYPAYFSFLLMPKKAQKKLEILWGLAAEIRAIPLLVTNPLMGFMRLSTWRDQLPYFHLEEAEPWLNSYEVFFDDQVPVPDFWQRLIVPEALLMQHSLRLLDPNISEDMQAHAYNLGLCLGIIYLLQNDHKFGFAATTDLKYHLCQQLKTYLENLNTVKLQKPIFYLLGYCQAWVEKYEHYYHPITLSEGRIQWEILKRKFKIWQN